MTKSGMITKLGIVSREILTLFSEVKGSLCVREIEVNLGEPAKHFCCIGDTKP